MKKISLIITLLALTYVGCKKTEVVEDPIDYTTTFNITTSIPDITIGYEDDMVDTSFVLNSNSWTNQFTAKKGSEIYLWAIARDTIERTISVSVKFNGKMLFSETQTGDTLAFGLKRNILP